MLIVDAQVHIWSSDAFGPERMLLTAEERA